MKFKLIPITQIEENHYIGNVHDLTVENDHSYTANNVIVHNSICKTRIVTGHGVPMFSCILECAAAADAAGVQLVADGGIKSSGDIIKALVAGADAVMVGSLLAGTDETPGKREFSFRQMRHVKSYRGMASSEAQDDRQWGSNQVKVAPEGVATTVPCKGPVRDVIQELTMGIKSGMSYCNARTLSEIPAKATWRRQTHSAYIEGTPHILGRKK